MNNKDKQIGARVDPKTFSHIEKAHKISGIPVSEIIRKGTLNEAIQIIQLFNTRLDKNKIYEAN